MLHDSFEKPIDPSRFAEYWDEWATTRGLGVYGPKQNFKNDSDGNRTNRATHDAHCFFSVNLH